MHQGVAMKRLMFGLLLVFVIGGCAASGPGKPRQDMLHDICWANDLFKVYEREQLAFTFNAQLPDKVVRRQWVWHIKTNQVFLNGSEQAISQAFVNDIYWLLFPLKAYESRDQVEVAVHRHQPSPLSKKDRTEVVIRYVGGQGYTPNDTYKLYVDDNLIVREWSYLKASQEPPARITTWTDYQTIGGIEFSLMREGRNGFKVWFTDVRVE
jgi:hypothetical protein